MYKGESSKLVLNKYIKWIQVSMKFKCIWINCSSLCVYVYIQVWQIYI